MQPSKLLRIGVAALPLTCAARSVRRALVAGAGPDANSCSRVAPRSIRFAALALFLVAAFEAFAIPTGPFFPLQFQNSWLYRVNPLNGFATEVRTITGTQLVGGALTFVQSDASTLDAVFLTNDSLGIRQHGNSDAATGSTVTLSPPVIVAPADVNPAAPPLITQSGTASISVPPGIVFPLGYSASSQFLGIEDIEISGRLFRAAHLRVSVTVSGFIGPDFVTETDVDDVWAVERVGIVRQIMAASSNVGPPTTDTYELLSTNVARADPEPFAFFPQPGVPLNTVMTSNAIRPVNTSLDSPVSISGGEYSIDGGPFTAAPGSVANGRSVTVRVVSSSGFSTVATATLVIGGISGDFSVTTLAEDATPAPFAFAPVAGVHPGAAVTSGAVVVSGINTAVAISIVGGEYSIDGGPFTAAPGSVANGQSVMLRVASSSGFSATTTATLTIGGVGAAFSVTTLAPATRAFVASIGSDAGPCTLAAPCRTLGAAVAVTGAGGEVVIVDSAGYGPVTISRPVSIIAPPGIYAGVSVTGGDGVTVSAGAEDRVVLRGLSVNGQGGGRGIVVQNGRVQIENCVVANMGSDGIQIQGGTVHISDSVLRSNARWGIGVLGITSDVQVSDARVTQNGGGGIHTESGGAIVLDRVRLDRNGGSGVVVMMESATLNVMIRDSGIAANAGMGVSVAPAGPGSVAHVIVERSSAIGQGGDGFSLSPGPGASATLAVDRSVAADNNGAGVAASGSGATVHVRKSTVARNATGFLQGDGAVFNTCGDNLLELNGTASGGAISASPCNE